MVGNRPTHTGYAPDASLASDAPSEAWSVDLGDPPYSSPVVADERVFVAIAFSSAVRSTTLALAGAIGLYFLFEFIWGIALQILCAASEGFELRAMAESGQPAWFEFSNAINPIVAYDSAARAVIESLPRTLMLAQSDAFYAQGWFGFVVLAFWLLIPLTLGYLRFNSTDL